MPKSRRVRPMKRRRSRTDYTQKQGGSWISHPLQHVQGEGARRRALKNQLSGLKKTLSNSMRSVKSTFSRSARAMNDRLHHRRKGDIHWLTIDMQALGGNAAGEVEAAGVAGVVDNTLLLNFHNQNSPACHIHVARVDLLHVCLGRWFQIKHNDKHFCAEVRTAIITMNTHIPAKCYPCCSKS